MKTATMAAAALAAACMAGCVSLKTESEIKPIHITMDVNLKVDRELDKAFAGETPSAPKGPFAKMIPILDRGAAGIANTALLVPREGATDDDRIAIAEENLRRMKNFEAVAKESGVAVEAVQRRRAAQMREKTPAGSGVWVQDESGAWSRK